MVYRAERQITVHSRGPTGDADYFTYFFFTYSLELAATHPYSHLALFCGLRLTLPARRGPVSVLNACRRALAVPYPRGP